MNAQQTKTPIGGKVYVALTNGFWLAQLRSDGATHAQSIEEFNHLTLYIFVIFVA